MLSVTWALVPLSVQMTQLQGAAVPEHPVAWQRRKWLNFRGEDDFDLSFDLIFSLNNSGSGKT